MINRDGAERTLAVKLDEAGTGERASKAALGISVEKSKTGLVIIDVNPNSRAADAGLREGDVIQEVNRQPVQSVEELRAAVRKTTERPVLLLVERDGHNLFVTVRPANS